MGAKEVGEIILKDRFSTEEQQNYERFIEALAQIVLELLEDQQDTGD